MCIDEPWEVSFQLSSRACFSWIAASNTIVARKGFVTIPVIISWITRASDAAIDSSTASLISSTWQNPTFPSCLGIWFSLRHLEFGEWLTKRGLHHTSEWLIFPSETTDIPTGCFKSTLFETSPCTWDESFRGFARHSELESADRWRWKLITYKWQETSTYWITAKKSPKRYRKKGGNNSW